MGRAASSASSSGGTTLPLWGYRLDDADTARCHGLHRGGKDAVDRMRDAGQVRTLGSDLPAVPGPEITEALKGVSTVAVLDKNISLRNGGRSAPGEIGTLRFGAAVYDYIIALGGRDVRKRDIAAVVDLAEGRREICLRITDGGTLNG